MLMNRSKGLLSCAAFAALVTFPARADASFELASYLDAPGGAQIAAGDYAAAVTAIPRKAGDATASLIAATNLCVALTMQRQLDTAAKPCDASVSLARRIEQRSLRELRSPELMSRALSNRGVLRALRGDALGAASDFKAAAKQADRWDAPSRNLAWLEATPLRGVAVAETAPE